jgi:hypothetical protein
VWGQRKATPAVVGFGVHSVGKYVSVVCGTGKTLRKWGSNSLAPGSFSKIGGDPSKNQAFYSNLVATLKYSLEFAGTVGQFYWHNDGPGPKPESTVKPATIPKVIPDPSNDGKFTNDPKTYVWAGMIELGPPSQPAKDPGVPIRACPVRTPNKTLRAPASSTARKPSP